MVPYVNDTLIQMKDLGACLQIVSASELSLACQVV